MGQDYPFTDPSPGANPHIYLSLLPSTGVKKPALKERGWEVEVVHLVTGQWSVREKEWLEALRIFGIGKEHGQRILGRLGRTLLNEHEKLFGSYWRQTFGPSRSVLQLLGKGISVRTSRHPQGD
jgi:hypothetical protein